MNFIFSIQMKFSYWAKLKLIVCKILFARVACIKRSTPASVIFSFLYKMWGHLSDLNSYRAKSKLISFKFASAWMMLVELSSASSVNGSTLFKMRELNVFICYKWKSKLRLSREVNFVIFSLKPFKALSVSFSHLSRE